MTISDQIRKAISESQKPLHVLAAESGVSSSMLWRFMNGKDIRLETADRLAEFFGLELAPSKASKRPAKGGKKTRRT